MVKGVRRERTSTSGGGGVCFGTRYNMMISEFVSYSFGQFRSNQFIIAYSENPFWSSWENDIQIVVYYRVESGWVCCIKHSEPFLKGNILNQEALFEPFEFGRIYYKRRVNRLTCHQTGQTDGHWELATTTCVFIWRTLTRTNVAYLDSDRSSYPTT